MTEAMIKLGVNVDHVATLRNARGTTYPVPYDAAELAKLGGADGITIHLREDRRHIIDSDVEQFCQNPMLPINLEMAATEEMLAIAINSQPEEVCIVPEKREELTTEGGLDVLGREAYLTEYISKLNASGIKVSLFIAPDAEQINASHRAGAQIIELHTGYYAELYADRHLDDNEEKLQAELNHLIAAAKQASDLGLVVNAGHGLTLDNVTPITQLPNLYCLNIGHSLIADAVFKGMEQAVRDMLQAINK